MRRKTEFLNLHKKNADFFVRTLYVKVNKDIMRTI